MVKRIIHAVKKFFGKGECKDECCKPVKKSDDSCGCCTPKKSKAKKKGKRK